LGVLLLLHVRDIFNERDADKLPSKTLVRDLKALEAADGLWSEYCIGNERPHRLTPNALARLLRPFGIRPRVLWPAQPRTSATKSARGYFRADFEAAWASYCGEGVTPSQPQRLRLVK
jgi:hypothetical protein